MTEPHDAGHGDDGEWPPWPPPRPLESAATERRLFDAAGTAWIAWVAGEGVAGTGSYNLALIEAVHFAAAAEPDRPIREALLAHGTFQRLADDELARLCVAASRIDRSGRS